MVRFLSFICLLRPCAAQRKMGRAACLAGESVPSVPVCLDTVSVSLQARHPRAALLRKRRVRTHRKSPGCGVNRRPHRAAMVAVRTLAARARATLQPPRGYVGILCMRLVLFSAVTLRVKSSLSPERGRSHERRCAGLQTSASGVQGGAGTGPGHGVPACRGGAAGNAVADNRHDQRRHHTRRGRRGRRGSTQQRSPDASTGDLQVESDVGDEDSGQELLPPSPSLRPADQSEGPSSFLVDVVTLAGLLCQVRVHPAQGAAAALLRIRLGSARAKACLPHKLHSLWLDRPLTVEATGGLLLCPPQHQVVT